MAYSRVHQAKLKQLCIAMGERLQYVLESLVKASCQPKYSPVGKERDPKCSKRW